jgi:hypothetical protein
MANDFPGARYLKEMFDVLTSSLEAQKQALDGHWEQLNGGAYNLGHFVQFLSKVHESNVNSLERLFRGNRGANQSSPSWCHLEITKPVTTNDLHRVADTRPRMSTTSPITTTPLASFNGPHTFELSTPDGISATKLVFDVVKFRYHDGSVEKEVDLTNEAGRKQFDAIRTSYPGQYLGIIFDNTSQSQPPLVIVTLTVG